MLSVVLVSDYMNSAFEVRLNASSVIHPSTECHYADLIKD
jgi:hypothetical protein